MQSLKDFLGEPKLKEFINFVLSYLSTLDIPIKVGSGHSHTHVYLRLLVQYTTRGPIVCCCTRFAVAEGHVY